MSMQKDVPTLTWCKLEPIVEDISYLIAPMFCMYIAFCVFAVMNSVTGVFVDKAMTMVHRDQEKYLASICRKVFMHAENHLLTSEQFSNEMQSEEFIEFFEAIDVHVEESEGFFALLDVDKQGEIDFETFLHGILRVRGSAKSLDLTLLMHECEYMFTRISEHMVSTDILLRKILGCMSGNFTRQASNTKVSAGLGGGLSRGASM
mmetsp:Transcript_67516/g.124447  ORF Transcript_67516/g.124447 Transcript_67516/m.124447 type:complete len:205 (-) Transcript_67516:42-656(-)